MEYISINRASELFSVSASTIKRYIKPFKTKGVHKGKSIVQLEPLPTGHKKIFILHKYLSELFNGSFNEPLNEPLKENSAHIKDLQSEIEFLRKQIDGFRVIEDKTIELILNLQRENRELKGQREINVISVSAEETSFENVSDTTETQKEPTEENIMQSFVKAKGEKRVAILKENKVFEKLQPRSMSDWLKDLK